MDEDGEETKQEDSDKQNAGEENKEPLDTIEDLVDQMEIVISDHEEEQGEGQKGGVATKDERVEKAAERVESTGVKGHKREERKRQRRSSILEVIEFRPISLDYQLSDDDIIELMELLQVRAKLVPPKCQGNYHRV